MSFESNDEVLKCALREFSSPSTEEGYSEIREHYAEEHSIEAEDGLIRSYIAQCSWCGGRHDSLLSVLACPCEGHMGALVATPESIFYAGAGHAPFAQAILSVPPPNAPRKWPCSVCLQLVLPIFDCL